MQELLALLIFRSQHDPLMEGKPIIIYNRIMPDGSGFWDALVTLLQHHGHGDACYVVNDVAAVVPSLVPLLKPFAD